MDVFQFLSYMVEQEHIALEELMDNLSDELLTAPLDASEEDTIG